MTHLRLLDGDYGGFNVDRLTHSLQTATRARTEMIATTSTSRAR